MADMFSPEKRRYVMSRIRGKNTKIELAVGRMLRRAGIRFTRHPDIFGRPVASRCSATGTFDTATTMPTGGRGSGTGVTREGNMRRDRQVTRRLRREEYSVVRLWERDIERRPDVCIRRIIRTVRSRDPCSTRADA